MNDVDVNLKYVLQGEDFHKYDNYFVDLIGWGRKDLLGKISSQLKRVSVKIYPTRSEHLKNFESKNIC